MACPAATGRGTVVAVPDLPPVASDPVPGRGLTIVLLGAPELCRDVHPIPLSPLERGILALLALPPRRVVSTETLIDSLWTTAPHSARTRVHALISGLRHKLASPGLAHPGGAGHGVTGRDLAGRDLAGQNLAGQNLAGLDGFIVSQQPGYRLRDESIEVDVDRFDQDIAAADAAAAGGCPDQAAQLLRSALDRWRGPALAGVRGPFAESARAGLEERRLRAVEKRMALELGLGRHEHLVEELAALVAAHPLRERLRAHLMVALVRSGRHVDALESYRRYCGWLRAEYGLEAGAELRALHQAVLVEDATLLAGLPAAGPADEIPTAEPAAPAAPAEPAAPAAPLAIPAGAADVPAQLPLGLPGFTGRVDALHQLDAVLRANHEEPDGVPVCAVSGPAGVGKTVLAVRWAHQVAGHFPDGQLYVNLRGFDPTRPPVDAARVLPGFLQALGVPPLRIPDSVATQAALFRSTVTGRRMLVLLDNAQDAEQVRPLLPGSPGSLVVVTSRDPLTSLAVVEGAQLIALDLFDRAEARQLLVRRLGAERAAAEPAAVDELIDLCARLPLALAITAARARTRPRVSLAGMVAELRAHRRRLVAFRGADPAVDLHAVFSTSYRQVEPAAATLFRLFGLHPGPDLTAAAAASLAAVPPVQAAAQLAELAAAQLMIEHVPGRYTCHDLLRAFATELVQETGTPADRQAATERLFDHYLCTAARGDALLSPPRERLDVRPGPGVRPEELVDAKAAGSWFAAEHATLLPIVHAAGPAGLDRYLGPLAHALTTYLDRHGHWYDWVAAEQAALDAAVRLADPRAQARASYGLGRALVQFDRLEDAYPHLRAALDGFERLDDQPGQARTHFNLAWWADRRDEVAAALHHSQQALRLYRASGSAAEQTRALNMVGWYHARLGDYPKALEYCTEAVTVADRIGDRYAEASALDSIGYAYYQLGQYDEAVPRYQKAIDTFRSAGDRYAVAEVTEHLADAHEAAGRGELARPLWREALDILDELEHPDAAAVRTKLATAGAG